LRIELDGDVTGGVGSSPFKVTMLSGAVHSVTPDFGRQRLSKFANWYSFDTIESGVGHGGPPVLLPYNGKWNHYAFTFQNSGSAVSDGVTLNFMLMAN
jgi:hypothetical protein